MGTRWEDLWVWIAFVSQDAFVRLHHINILLIMKITVQTKRLAGKVVKPAQNVGQKHDLIAPCHFFTPLQRNSPHGIVELLTFALGTTPLLIPDFCNDFLV